LFDAGFLEGGEHKLGLGPVAGIPWLKNQERLTFARCGIIDPISVEQYRGLGGFAGLQRALAMEPGAIIQQVLDSGLRGRGGSAYPTGIRWKAGADAQADRKSIVCSADEGDRGTFSGRMIMEGDPLSLIDGMAIAGLAVGADKGYIYLRSEYPLT